MVEPFPPNRQADAELLERADRDPNAIEELYRRHAPAVLALLGRRHAPEVAADLTAETFCAVLIEARRYSSDRGAAVAWIFGIAMNKSADYWRSQAIDRRAMNRLKIEPPDYGTDDLRQIEERLSAESSKAALERSMATLSEQERALVEALVVDDVTAVEYAALVGSKPATIRKRLQRTLTALRLNMQESR